MLEPREPPKTCNFGATQSEKELCQKSCQNVRLGCIKAWPMAHHMKKIYSCIYFIMLAHHQLAEHNEHVRSAIDSLRARAVESTRGGGGHFGYFDFRGYEHCATDTSMVCNRYMDENCISCPFIS